MISTCVRRHMNLAAARAAVTDIRSMQLRNGSIVGGSPGTLSTSGRELFEEGVGLVFQRWTALCLAIDQQWGGQSSAEKAEDLYSDVLHWFEKNTGIVHARSAVLYMLLVAGMQDHTGHQLASLLLLGSRKDAYVTLLSCSYYC